MIFKLNKIIIFALLLIIIYPIISTAQATPPTTTQDGYVMLVPIPGVGDASGNAPTKLDVYIPALFKLAIGIAAVLAFVVITYGGFLYAVSDSLSGKDDGKKYITNAIYGLLLVIGAWIILNTINPQLLNFNLNIKKPNITEPTPVNVVPQGRTPLAGYALTQSQIDLNNKMKDDLKNNYNVDVNNGPCTDPKITTGCTNLVGMPAVSYSGVTNLKKMCNCNVTITGGTEGGHTTHGPNLPTLDLSKNSQLDAYIKKNAFGPVVQTTKGPVYTVNINGRGVEFLDEIGGDPHWHVNF